MRFVTCTCYEQSATRPQPAKSSAAASWRLHAAARAKRDRNRRRVLSQLARRGEVKPEALSQAIEKYGLDVPVSTALAKE